MDEELKQQIKSLILEMLGKADEKIKSLEATVEEMVTKAKSSGVDFTNEIKSLKDEIKRVDEIAEDFKNDLADFELKGTNPSVVMQVKERDELQRKAVKSAIGQFLKAKKSEGRTFNYKRNENDPEDNFGMLLKDHIDHQFKVLNLTNSGEGLESVDEVLSREIIERARDDYPIIGMVRYRQMPRSLREEVLISFPSVQEGLENVAGANLAETDTQTYAEVKNHIAKIHAKPRITDEAMFGSDLGLYEHLLVLLDDEVGRRLASQIYFGNGTGKNMRGMLSSNRLDITNLTGESFKPTFDLADPSKARDPDFYAAFPTGVSGGIGADDAAKIDYLIKMRNKLPKKYRKGAKWLMNTNTLEQFELTKNANGDPIYITSFAEGAPNKLAGYPVEIDETLPDYNVADAPFIIFGNVAEAFSISDGDIDKMVIDNITVDGCTVVKLDKEYFEMVGKNDAIIIGVATTNSGS